MRAISGPADSWEGRPADKPDPRSCNGIEPTRIVRVAAHQRATAVKMLEKVPVVRIDHTVASNLGNTDTMSRAPLTPFLVRAVAKHELIGSFRAGLCDSVLAIQYGSLGRSSAPTVRAPVIVLLEQAPSAIYASWSTAE